jgi:predicted SAM-dependent methyltransferase
MRTDYFNTNTYLAKSLCLEISPLSRPILDPQNPNSRYLDIFSREELRIQYGSDPTIIKEDIVEVHYVDKGNNYYELVGADRFGLILASHVIEHVPDVLRWLNGLALILHDGGVVKLAIPDKRFCFDHWRRLTSVSDIVGANLEKRKKPTSERVYDYKMFARGDMNDPIKHHAGLYPDVIPLSKEMHDYAMSVALKSETEYVDAHCWVWTPESFIEQMNFLSETNMLHLKLVEAEMLYTPQDTFEFFVTFERK